jgi:hypothetical protein
MCFLKLNWNTGVVVIPVLRRYRQEDDKFGASLGGLHSEFEAILGYTVRPCIKIQKKKKLR